jgi:hypothetical protein
MPNTKDSRQLAIGLTALSILGRLVPHAPNVTPVGGSCLFAGSRIPGWLAYVLPVAVMLVTDPFVGGYTKGSLAIYAALLINVWIGRQMLQRRATPVRIGAAAFLGSLQFFLISNFTVWALPAARGHAGMYSTDLAGLLQTYTMALPFWGRTLAGDLAFTAGIFAVHALVSRRFASQPQTA